MKPNIEDVFKSWCHSVHMSDDVKYLHVNWTEHVEDLAVILYKKEIDYDEAKMYARKVVEFLTTEKGRKEKKDWPKNVEARYLEALAGLYVQIDSAPPIKKDRFVLDSDPEIVDYITNRYGPNQMIINEAHRIGSMFNLEYIDYVATR